MAFWNRLFKRQPQEDPPQKKLPENIPIGEMGDIHLHVRWDSVAPGKVLIGYTDSNMRDGQKNLGNNLALRDQLAIHLLPPGFEQKGLTLDSDAPLLTVAVMGNAIDPQDKDGTIAVLREAVQAAAAEMKEYEAGRAERAHQKLAEKLGGYNVFMLPINTLRGKTALYFGEKDDPFSKPTLESKAVIDEKMIALLQPFAEKRGLTITPLTEDEFQYPAIIVRGESIKKGEFEAAKTLMEEIIAEAESRRRAEEGVARSHTERLAAEGRYSEPQKESLRKALKGYVEPQYADVVIQIFERANQQGKGGQGRGT